jgi:hypothetical protein
VVSRGREETPLRLAFQAREGWVAMVVVMVVVMVVHDGRRDGHR